MLICPNCTSGKIVKNGKTYYGKQNHKCKDCNRQFVVDNHHTITEERRQDVSALLMERISLRGICRSMGGDDRSAVVLRAGSEDAPGPAIRVFVQGICRRCSPVRRLMAVSVPRGGEDGGLAVWGQEFVVTGQAGRVWRGYCKREVNRLSRSVYTGGEPFPAPPSFPRTGGPAQITFMQQLPGYVLWLVDGDCSRHVRRYEFKPYAPGDVETFYDYHEDGRLDYDSAVTVRVEEDEVLGIVGRLV